MNDIEKRLLAFIGTGESNAVTQQEITAVLGLDERTTRFILEKSRRNGTVICSSNAGRFYPADAAELRAYIKRIQSSVRSECVALAPARRLLAKWESES